MSGPAYYLVTPARRGRTGFRSRTHLAVKQGRRKMPQSLCKAENNTPDMEDAVPYARPSFKIATGPFTLREAENLYLGTKALCRNCVKLAAKGAP